MRKNRTKIISILCTLVLLIGMIYLPRFYSKADGETLFSQVINSGFNCVTLSDIGGNDTDATDETDDFFLIEDKTNVKLLDKTAFRAYTVFNNTTGSGKGTELHLFTQDGEKTGIALTIPSKNGKNLQLKQISNPAPNYSGKTFYATNAGIGATTFNGTYFLLGLTVEFIDSDNDGDQDDMKLGVFFNDKLYDNSYITIRNASSNANYKMGSRINFMGESGEIYSYTTPKKFSECPENSYDWLTLSDCEISDGSTNDKSGELPIDTLDKKLFNARVVFKGDSTSGTVLRLGATSATADDGIAIFAKGSSDPNLYLSVSGDEIPLLLRKTNINTTSSLDHKFDLQISTENVDGKLKLGIFINENLYNGEYFTFDNFDSLGTFVVFGGFEGEAYSVFPPIYLESSEVADFTLITLSDLGIANGNSNANGSYSQSFDRTVLGMNVKFSGEGARLHYANPSTSSYSGLGIRLEGKDLVVSCEAGSNEEKLVFEQFKITPDDAKINSSTFANNQFLLHISCEFVDFGGNTDKKDVKIGLFINGLLYKSEYLYIIDCADRMCENFNFAESGAKSYSSIETAPKPFPEHLKKITLTDAGLGYGSGSVSGKFRTINNLDGTIFGAHLKFNKNSSRMHIGFNDNSYGGIGVRLEDEKIVVGNELGAIEGALSNIGVSVVKVDPVAAGVGETFVDKEFLLQMSFEFVDCEKDGNKNDIKFGVFVNGKLCTNSYYYVKDQADLLGLGINFNEGGVASYAPYVATFDDTNLDNFRKITLSDARIGTGSGNAKGNFLALNSLNNTLFSAKLKFNTNSSRMHIGTKTSDYSGFGIRLENDKLIIGNELGDQEGALSSMGLYFIEIDPKAAGIGDTFVDEEFLLQMSFEFVDRVGDKKADDIKLGVYIDGNLFADTYFYIYNEAENLGLGINFSEGGAAAYESYGEVIPSGREHYKELTPRDFMIADSEYKNASVTSIYDYNTLDGIAVTTKVKFSADSVDQCAFYFGKTWMGARVALQSDGKLQISHLHEDGTQVMLAKIDPKSVGLTTFVNTDFVLRLTFDTIKAEDGYVHYRLGAFVNGKPCDSGAYLVKYTKPVTLQSTMFIYAGKSGSVSISSEKAPVDFSVFGLQKSTWKKTLGIN